MVDIMKKSVLVIMMLCFIMVNGQFKMEKTSDFVKQGSYYIMIQDPNDYSQEYFTWNKDGANEIIYSIIETSFNYNKHSINIFDLPENELVYIGATAIQKYITNVNGWHPTIVKTYVNGQPLEVGNFSDGFRITDAHQVNKTSTSVKLMVYATRLNRIEIFIGDTPFNLIKEVGSDGFNSTDMGDGTFRHGRTFTLDFTKEHWWKADLYDESGNKIYTSIRKII